MHRLFIMGSCVSRDAFEYFDKNAFSLTAYFARSSIGSSFSGIAAKDIYSSRIASAFQRNQVKSDLLKTLPAQVAGTDFDTLIVDFIDERFPLFRFNDGSIATVSIELHQLDALKCDEGEKIPEFSDEHFSYWLRGWHSFIENAKRNQFIDKIIINKAHWAAHTIDGGCLQSSGVDVANAYLNRLYRVCSETLKDRQFLEYDQSLLVSDPSHKWGLAPFHYARPFYERARDFMGTRLLT